MQKTSYAIFNRIYVRLGFVAALVGGFSLTAQAAYTNLAPPPGWSAGGAAAVDSYAAQTANQWINNAARSSAMLNAGGKQIAVNVALKLGPTAPKVIAAAIFANPYLRAGVGIASWLGVGKVAWDSGLNAWVRPDGDAVVSTGKEYLVTGTIWSPTKEAACALHYAAIAEGQAKFPNDFRNLSFSSFEPTCSYKYEARSGLTWLNKNDNANYQTRNSSCPAGWYVTPAGCTQTAPPKQLTQQEMIDLLNPANQPGWPMPDSVPNELPAGTPLPVELPIVNPTPGANPTSKPLFVPTGDPVKNPSYNPEAPTSPTNQPYLQPGTTVTPRPTTANPWQVDIQPVDRPQTGAEPLPETEQNPDSQEGDKPKEEDQKSLCEKHPDILACQKPELDTPDGEIPKSTRDVSLQEENLFGGGSCPADVYFTPHGLQQMKIWDWNQSCSYITSYVKPILIICCTFAAFMILIPGRTE